MHVMPLSPHQKRHLRGLAHALNPIVTVGGKGLTEAVLAELEIALDHHELVKLKVGAEDREQRRAMIAEIAARSGSEVVQTVGHTATVYRRNADQPRIPLPGR
jgi:RNA-binding protein